MHREQIVPQTSRTNCAQIVLPVRSWLHVLAVASLKALAAARSSSLLKDPANGALCSEAIPIDLGCLQRRRQVPLILCA